MNKQALLLPPFFVTPYYYNIVFRYPITTTTVATFCDSATFKLLKFLTGKVNTVLSPCVNCSARKGSKTYLTGWIIFYGAQVNRGLIYKIAKIGNIPTNVILKRGHPKIKQTSRTPIPLPKLFQSRPKKCTLARKLRTAPINCELWTLHFLLVPLEFYPSSTNRAQP